MSKSPKLLYRLSDPGFTIYHRAALAGLASTIDSWKGYAPDGIEARINSDYVEIDWADSMSDQEALRRLLSASFRLTDSLQIDLPGQRIGNNEAIRIAIHNAICQTFLQHPKMRPGEKQARLAHLKSADDETPVILSYKAVLRYAHQSAQGTGLLDEKHKGKFPEIATIPQSLVPGAFSGSMPLQGPPEEVILLLFLMVGCAFFHLRPRNQESKFQYCVVVPDVTDLNAFANVIARINHASQDKRVRTSSYEGRIVGGPEEAALRFLLDFRVAETLFQESCVSECQTIAMGKVAWDKNQINRSLSTKVKTDYPDIQIFDAADWYWKNRKRLESSEGHTFVVPRSALPELIAANLCAGRFWYSRFYSIVSEKKSMRQLLFEKEGLIAMKNAIQDEDDLAVINAFHDAWRWKMRTLYERARDQGLDADRLLEVEREKVRNSILRMKNTDMLTGWFLRFCADATGGASLSAIKSDSERIRKFIFSSRNFERFQNLCLFALVRYESKTPSLTGV